MGSISDNVFLLHSRAFSDSRLILDMFSQNNGRFSALFRIPSKKYTFRPRPFSLMHTQAKGKADLKTLTVLDPIEPSINLAGEGLFCAMYVNELILRLVQPGEAYTDLFDCYRDALSLLGELEYRELVLRKFEFSLLAEIGYAINFYDDCYDQTIIDTTCYSFHGQRGFIPLLKSEVNNNAVSSRQYQPLFTGKEIAMFRQDFFLPTYRLAFFNGDPEFFPTELMTKRFQVTAKKISRLALQTFLGARPLASRSFFTSANKS